MDTVQIPDSKRFDTQMSVHIEIHNDDMSLAQEFRKHLYNASHKHGILDQGKHTKKSSKQKWENGEYRVQHNKYVKHQYMNMYCATNHFH